MLCRSCGNETIPFEYCPDCNEAIHHKCVSCGKEDDKSVHIHSKSKTQSMIVIGTMIILGLSVFII